MRIAFLFFCVIQCLVSTGFAQVFPALSQRQELLPFVNPGAKSYGEMAIDESKSLSALFSYRQHLNALDEASPKSYLLGAYYHLRKGDNAFWSFPISAWGAKYDATPLSFGTFSLSAGAMFKPSSLFQFSLGFSFGYNGYHIGRLRPWNLGDPILQLIRRSDGSFHVGAGLFISSDLPLGKNTATLYGGVSTPYISLCKGDNCYIFNADTRTFLISGRQKWNLLAKYVQLGFFLDVGNDYWLNFHSYSQQTVPGYWQTGFLSRVEKVLGKRNRFRLGTGLNSSGIWSTEVGFLFDNSSKASNNKAMALSLGFTFDVFLSGQYFGPIIENNLVFHRDAY